MKRHVDHILLTLRQTSTVDQFFALKVPMRPGELSSLFRGIDNAFQVYARHVVDKLASKEDIIPPVPILTRYSREGGIKAFVKKELIDPRLPDVKKSSEINVLTTPMLCVQLNTLYSTVCCCSALWWCSTVKAVDCLGGGDCSSWCSRLSSWWSVEVFWWCPVLWCGGVRCCGGVQQ
ncbi:unnamed protein product [Ilex paraguariensis]|uniref:PATROL1-like C-terminal domain-containing protein n=1 Tax=Ilex paraguariensis TaxID=185542 RepID=A0ABC8QUX2_9AQUA